MGKILFKIKWWILVWAVYAFWVYAALSDYRYNLDSEEKGLWVFWTIVVPIILYLIYSLYRHYKDKSRNEKCSKNNTYNSIDSAVAIQKSRVWPLMEFANEHGKLQMRCDDGGKWSRFKFADGIEGHIANVLKNYSVEDIKNTKEKISIRVLESGDYCMCLDWEDIDI